MQKDFSEVTARLRLLSVGTSGESADEHVETSVFILGPSPATGVARQSSLHIGVLCYVIVSEAYITSTGVTLGRRDGGRVRAA